MQVNIVGTGYVGLTTGVALGYLGHRVTCVDKNPRIVETLKSGVPTIHEPGLDELMAGAAPNMTYTVQMPELVGESVVVIAVGTPTKGDGDADLQYVDSAAQDIADRIQPGARIVIVNKSTVPIGSAKHVAGIVARRLAERGVEAEVAIASNPEFLAEGRAVHDTLYPDRVVIGSDTQWAVNMLREMYQGLLEQSFEAPTSTPRPERYQLPALITTTTTSAELTKYAANCFLATKISFINEFAGLAELVGADITEVARAIGLDTRIGAQFLAAGIGWGGSCFGKDTRAIIAMANKYEYPMKIVESAIDMNLRQRRHVVDLLQRHLKVLRGMTIGILGLAFKPNTDDLRDAPALTLIELLHDRGVVLRAHDPVAMDVCKEQHPNLPVTYADSIEHLAEGCDALVVVTDWAQYKHLDWEALRGKMKGNLVVDARNMLNAKDVRRHGMEYVGIGR